MLRALVACGWYGIQSWFGGLMIYALIGVLIGHQLGGTRMPLLGINPWQGVCFLAFWLMQFYFIVHGIESIRRLETYTAPIKVVICIMLLVWAYDKAGGFGPMVHERSQFVRGAPQSGRFYSVFWPSLTAMVGFWSTLALNIPDFTRFARSQRDQIVGQAIGLPVPMGLLAALAVFVTSATVVIYGRAIWDPVTLAGRMRGAAVLLALLVLLVDTISVNLAANLVGPAFDFSSLAPKRISYRAGGYITASIAIVMMPWKILESTHGYISTWLVGYSALLGSVAGILIVDYYHLRRRVIDVQGLYRLQTSPYSYRSGWNPIAVSAFLIGVIPCLPGFVHASLPQALPHLSAFLGSLYDYAWFVALAFSAFAYAAGMHIAGFGRPVLAGQYAGQAR
jgi:NCS1 family nucleobase:cation symporter-1